MGALGPHRQGKGLRAPPLPHEHVPTSTVTFPPCVSCRVDECSVAYPSTYGRLPSACFCELTSTKEDITFPVAYVSFKAPTHILPISDSEVGQGRLSKEMGRGCSLMYVMVTLPSLRLRSWRKRFSLARPHRGLGAPLRNTGLSSQTELLMYFFSHFRFTIYGQNS